MIVHLLTEALIHRGHRVTLFASGDSHTHGNLVAPCDYALRHDPQARGDNLWRLNRKHVALEQIQLKRLYEQAGEFDVIHSHLEMSALPFAARSTTPTLHTLHMDLIPETCQILSQYGQQAFVSVSDAQRKPCPTLNYVGTVHNAIDLEALPFFAKPQSPEYLAFLGRISPEKGIHHAIAIAQQIQIPLRIAGKFGQEDADFFESVIKPEIDGQHIQYLGEITQAEKIALLGQASVTLFPITWNEPFGIVMIESMACGTPVLGMRMGAVPEVIQPGVSGLICDSVEEMARQVEIVRQFDRWRCREAVKARFSVERMVDAYEACYARVLGLDPSDPT
ncbi:glycosyltransferase family 4 protein [Lyngbya confervoides BDU141951]|uniref:Glycosyltransferase family 4 protein n=2 Tax=Lyngbya TaxID=28073 RepID=A0ABD4T1D4_9CYAN|nr:glycosyltransferase family 4 protein [Lyngbya confervoides BDU141951]